MGKQGKLRERNWGKRVIFQCKVKVLKDRWLRKQMEPVLWMFASKDWCFTIDTTIEIKWGHQLVECFVECGKPVSSVLVQYPWETRNTSSFQDQSIWIYIYLCINNCHTHRDIYIYSVYIYMYKQLIVQTQPCSKPRTSIITVGCPEYRRCTYSNVHQGALGSKLNTQKEMNVTYPMPKIVLPAPWFLSILSGCMSKFETSDSSCSI